MNLWEIYCNAFKNKSLKETLEVFAKDAAEIREQIVWTQYILDTEIPNSKATHEWNVARNALGNHIEDVKKAYDNFMENVDVKHAIAFANEVQYCSIALDLAKNAIWYNNFKGHWNERKQ